MGTTNNQSFNQFIIIPIFSFFSFSRINMYWPNNQVNGPYNDTNRSFIQTPNVSYEDLSRSRYFNNMYNNVSRFGNYNYPSFHQRSGFQPSYHHQASYPRQNFYYRNFMF